MGRGADVCASRAASMTSKTYKKERRRGPSIKDGVLFDTGFLLDIVGTGVWITRTLMSVKLTVRRISCPRRDQQSSCPVQTRTERTTKKAAYPSSRIVPSVRAL